MTEIPKLTAAEATQLRYWHSASPTEDAFDKGLLAIMGMSFEPSLTDLGRSALAAYDAAERAKIEEALLVELAGDLPGIDPKEDDTATGVEYERREKTMLARHREKIRSQIRGEAIEECIACADSVVRVLQSADSDGIAAFFSGGDARRPAEAAALTVRDSIRANVKP